MLALIDIEPIHVAAYVERQPGSPRTTKLYDRTSDEITLDEIERILI